MTPDPRQPFAGRRVLAIAAVAVFAAGVGQTYGFSPFVEPMVSELGVSRSLFALAYSAATLACAASLLPAGRLIDRYGSRAALGVTALVLAGGLLLMGTVGGMVAALAAMTVLRSGGAGILPLAARNLVPFWYVRRRGWAFSMLGLASIASVAVIPPLHQFLVSSVGWRTAWRIDAAALAALVPVFLLLVRNRPEQVGQLPDGDAPLAPHEVAARRVEDWGYTLAAAARTPAFWAVAVANLVPSMLLTGMGFNQVAMLAERGLPPTFAATTFTVEAAASLPFTLAAGWFVDRRPFRRALALAELLMSAAVAVLLLRHDAAGAVVYAALRGMCVGLWLVAVDVAWPAWFGRRHLGAIRGAGTAIGLAGAALGPIPFGIARDLLGSYDPALAALLALPVLSAVFMLLVPTPERVGQRPASPA